MGSPPPPPTLRAPGPRGTGSGGAPRGPGHALLFTSRVAAIVFLFVVLKLLQSLLSSSVKWV